jgi:hypothetical protein
MNKITFQSIFNKAWRKIVVGKQPPCLKLNVDGLEEGSILCAYESDGIHCAIGWSLPENICKHRGTFAQLVRHHPNLFDKKIVNTDNKSLDKFQFSLHDYYANFETYDWEDGTNLEKEYRKVAKDYNLHVPKTCASSNYWKQKENKCTANIK